MYQPQVHLHSLYNNKSNKCDVGLLWINMVKIFMFHKYIESYFIKYSKSGQLILIFLCKPFPIYMQSEGVY